MNALIAPSGARIMLWDDGIEADPSIMKALPRNAVIVNWHYDRQAFVAVHSTRSQAAASSRWSRPARATGTESFRTLRRALPNERRFIDEGKIGARARAVSNGLARRRRDAVRGDLVSGALRRGRGVEQQVDGFAADFPSAFFGVDDARYARTMRCCSGALDAQSRRSPATSLLWADPFAPSAAAAMQKRRPASVSPRCRSASRPHLIAAHAPAARKCGRGDVARGAALRRARTRYQIAREVRDYYADAACAPRRCDCAICSGAGTGSGSSATPTSASRSCTRKPGGTKIARAISPSNLERYHLDAQRAIERADAIDRVTYDDYLPNEDAAAARYRARNHAVIAAIGVLAVFLVFALLDVSPDDAGDSRGAAHGGRDGAGRRRAVCRRSARS